MLAEHIKYLERKAEESGEVGRQEGLQEGRQEGLQEGRQEGRQEGLQKAVIDVLAARFGPVDTGRLGALFAIRDPEQLSALVREAATIESLDGFIEALEA